MLSQENIQKIRTEVNKWDNPRNQGYRGLCQAWVTDVYRACGLNAPSYCCANMNRDTNAKSGNPENGDIIFSGTNYHNEACGVCPREAGHTAIYIDGWALGSQTVYWCKFDDWVRAFGYGGHTNYNQDYVAPQPTRPSRVQCIQHEYNGTEAEMWKLVPDGNYYKIVNKSGKCLDVKGGTSDKSSLENRTVQAWKDNGTDAQRWKLEKDNAKGWYVISSKIDSNYVLDISNSAIFKKAYVQLHHRQTEEQYKWAQRFYILPIKENKDYQAIINAHSFYAVDANPCNYELNSDGSYKL